MNNSIVILGGMGPQASIKLHEMVIKGSENMHDGSPTSYPAILHASIPVPDFTNSDIAYAEALELIRSVCNTLPMAEASTIGIACNTAHLMVEQLPFDAEFFVSMIDAVVIMAKELSAKKVGLLASPHTIKSHLYHVALMKQGIEVVTPTKTQVKQINDVIHAVIKGKDTLAERATLTSIAKSLEKRGADTILLGCTELPIVGINNLSIPTIDSLSALAKAMLEHHYNRSV